jgi:hypothetical protein
MISHRISKHLVLNLSPQWRQEHKLPLPRVGQSYWLVERMHPRWQAHHWALQHRRPNRLPRLHTVLPWIAYWINLAEEPMHIRLHGRWRVVGETEKSIMVERVQ